MNTHPSVLGLLSQQHDQEKDRRHWGLERCRGSSLFEMSSLKPEEVNRLLRTPPSPNLLCPYFRGRTPELAKPESLKTLSISEGMRRFTMMPATARGCFSRVGGGCRNWLRGRVTAPPLDLSAADFGCNQQTDLKIVLFLLCNWRSREQHHQRSYYEISAIFIAHTRQSNNTHTHSLIHTHNAHTRL